MTVEPTVFVVDDNKAVRRLLRELISSVGLRVEVYGSTQEFLDAFEPGRPGCLVLDIRMPGKSGLELQKELAERAIVLPVIVLTGHGDVQVAVHAMKAGAVDFVEKPFNNELLLESVQKAVAKSVRADDIRRQRAEIARRIALLTPRERQVLDRVYAGEISRAIAASLDISDKTVEIHRAKAMKKMQASSVVSLVRMVAMLDDG